MIKNLPTIQETWVPSLGWENPLEKGMATHSSILTWKIPWTKEPDGLQSMELQSVRHDWVTRTFPFFLFYFFSWSQTSTRGLVVYHLQKRQTIVYTSRNAVRTARDWLTQIKGNVYLEVGGWGMWLRRNVQVASQEWAMICFLTGIYVHGSLLFLKLYNFILSRCLTYFTIKTIE